MKLTELDVAGSLSGLTTPARPLTGVRKLKLGQERSAVGLGLGLETTRQLCRSILREHIQGGSLLQDVGL